MKKFVQDKASLTKTLATFDRSSTIEDVTDSGRSKSSKHKHTFLLHVLLEHLCATIEKDDGKRLVLFHELCKKLSDIKVLDPSLDLEGFRLQRHEVSKALDIYARQMHNEMLPLNEATLVPYNILSTGSSCGSPVRQVPNRFEQMFEELQVIDSGGFGVVCKARHKIDGIIYAVKKIAFKYKNDSKYKKVIREAKNIAALRHPNVVSYNNAWIEMFQESEDFCDAQNKSSSKSSSQESSSSNESTADEDVKASSESILFEELDLSFENHTFVSKCERNTTCLGQSSSQRSFQRLEGNFSESYAKLNEHLLLHDGQKYFNFNTDDVFSPKELENGKKNLFPSDDSFVLGCTFPQLQIKAILCIQMEYCECDLRLWLDKRGEGEQVPFEMNIMDIFKGILKGVQYIHSKSIIHRDLKPKNIFYSRENGVMKIGDFGLATLVNYSSSPKQQEISSNYSAGLGTLPYAAPEQRKQTEYNAKVDIYSLGIILIELLQVFKTQAEFFNVVENVVLRYKFPDEMTQNWPNHISLVKSLVKRKPCDRLSAEEILRLPLLTEKVKKSGEIESLRCEVTELRETLRQKEEEIAHLKQVIKEKDSIINQQREVI